MTAVSAVRCAHCATELAPTLFRCPACGTLAHANRLGEIAADARRLEAEGKVSEALGRWNLSPAFQQNLTDLLTPGEMRLLSPVLTIH